MACRPGFLDAAGGHADLKGPGSSPPGYRACAGGRGSHGMNRPCPPGPRTAWCEGIRATEGRGLLLPGPVVVHPYPPMAARAGPFRQPGRTCGSPRAARRCPGRVGRTLCRPGTGRPGHRLRVRGSAADRGIGGPSGLVWAVAHWSTPADDPHSDVREAVEAVRDAVATAPLEQIV